MVTGNKISNMTLLSTNGEVTLPLSNGNWAVLYIYEGDFTPVSASDILALDSELHKFLAYDTNVYGVSTDSISSHLAFILSLKNQSRQGKAIDFELISDKNGELLKELGIGNGVESAVVIIDPEGVVRAISKGDTKSGINVTEAQRVLLSLKEILKNGVLTPANWTPGEQTLKPSPTTLDGAFSSERDARESGGYCTDWYICYNDTTLKI